MQESDKLSIEQTQWVYFGISGDVAPHVIIQSKTKSNQRMVCVCVWEKGK